MFGVNTAILHYGLLVAKTTSLNDLKELSLKNSGIKYNLLKSLLITPMLVFWVEAPRGPETG
jgi:hypothetical protein